jgi:hypothetical protein
MDKEQLLQTIKEFANRGEINLSDITPIFPAAASPQEGDSANRNLAVSRVLYAIGGLVVLTGLIVLLVRMWNSFSAFEQISVTLGSSIALYIAAVLLYNYRNIKPVSLVLFTISAVMMPIGIFIVLHHYSTGSNIWLAQIMIAGLPAAVFFLTSLFFRHPIFHFIPILFSTWTLYALMGLILENSRVGYQIAEKIWAYFTLAISIGYILLGYFFHSKEDRRPLASPLYFFGAVGLLGSTFNLSIQQEFWVFLYFFVIFLSIYLSTVLRSRSFLILGAIGLIAHIGRITAEYFGDSLNWPLMLIFSGFIVIGVGYGTVWLNNRFLKK